jgi:hypothetical protein
MNSAGLRQNKIWGEYSELNIGSEVEFNLERIKK